MTEQEKGSRKTYLRSQWVQTWVRGQGLKETEGRRHMEELGKGPWGTKIERKALGGD